MLNIKAYFYLIIEGHKVMMMIMTCLGGVDKSWRLPLKRVTQVASDIERLLKSPTLLTDNALVFRAL